MKVGIKIYVAVTGHRPEKINDWDYVRARALDAFDITGVTYLYEGQAAGFDLVAAELAYKHGIGYAACKPWKGHTGRREWIKRYELALRYADTVIDVNDAESYCGAWVYQKRNEFMIDNADYVIAVWDGSVGGTHNAVKYAERTGKRVWRINPAIHEVGWTKR